MKKQLSDLIEGLKKLNKEQLFDLEKAIYEEIERRSYIQRYENPDRCYIKKGR